MPKYLSGRQKRRPQDQLSDDRYQYLGLDQAEPNLSDPLVGPSPPSGSQYQLVAIPGHPGKRFWVPIGGGLIAGAISVFDEGAIVGTSNSITQLNFVGAAVTANVEVQSPSGHPGVAATVTVVPVTVSDNPPNTSSAIPGELWWESDTGDLFVYYDDGNSKQWVMANAGGQGQKGAQGIKGDTGPQGLQGSQGDKGEGQKGQKGETGSPGDKGIKGEPSTQAGADGDKGDKGDPSTVPGEKGSIGLKGDKGLKGEPGSGGGGGATDKISEGNTEAEVVDTGTDGHFKVTTDGAERFRIGNKGQLGIAGANYGTSGQVLASQGNNLPPQWVNASAGQKGDKGSGGAQVTISENAPAAADSSVGDLWWDSDDSDLHVYYNDGTSSQWVSVTNSGALKGAKGEPGEKGNQGNKGIKGDSLKGEKGAPGSATKGQKGEPGADGTDGTSVKGQKGEPGAATKGQKGAPGSATKGQKGEPGDKGDKGEPGVDGADGTAAINNNADNYVITGSNTAGELNAESTLTYDGSVLKVNGTGQALLTLRTTDNASDRGIAFQNSGNAYVASINVEDAGGSTGDLVFHVDDSNNTDLSLVEERLRIRKSGALAVGGATNYGTSGQVLTSNGNAAPTWATLGDINTQLEEVQDIVGAMFSGNTETNITATYQDSDGTIDLVATNTTYDLEVIDHQSSTGSGTGNDVKIRLNPSTGTNDDVRLIAGENIVLAHSESNDTITISASDTLTGTIDESNATKIITASGATEDNYHNITFVPITTANNSYQTLEIDSQDNVLAYNPYANKLRTTNLRVNRIYTSGDSPGTAGQLLTSGGNNAFTWTNASSVGTDTFANGLSFSSGTLTLTLTDSSTLTTTIPLSGITGNFTDLDDTPNSLSGQGGKVVRVNTAGNELEFVSSSSVGNDTNYYLTGLSFNTSNGVLTATVNGASNPTVDLDGRYAQSSAGVPLGTIVIWYGSISNIPSGWSLCNGTTVNGYATPDLRNKFVVGAWSDGANTNWPNLPPGDTGGSNVSSLPAHSHTINNHTHTINNHTHSFSATTGSDSHTHSYNSANHPTGSGPEQNQSGGPEDRTTFNVGKTTGSDSHSHSVSGTTGNPSNRGTGNPSDRGTDSQGSAGSKSNLPPYYALAYIMKTS
tara:strand:+ start:4158 stop:7574 length:3417 start_codon:yes stop_codon:yes gene_type:complete